MKRCSGCFLLGLLAWVFMLSVAASICAAPNPPNETESFMFMGELDGPMRLCDYDAVERLYTPSFTTLYRIDGRLPLTVSKKDLFKWWRKICSPDYSISGIGTLGYRISEEPRKTVVSWRIQNIPEVIRREIRKFYKLKNNEIGFIDATVVLKREDRGPILIQLREYAISH